MSSAIVPARGLLGEQVLLAILDAQPVGVAEIRAALDELGHDGADDGQPFQARAHPWLMACFGPTIAADRVERHHRFLEEALELVQATGCTADEAHQLVEYVYSRPVGEVGQEVGGVMVTLAALCLAHELDMHAAGETELTRVWTKVDAIRAKQALKPKFGPLPIRQCDSDPERLKRAAAEVLAAHRTIDAAYADDSADEPDYDRLWAAIEALAEELADA